MAIGKQTYQEREKYNLENPVDKMIILDFEKEIKGKTFWQYLLFKGYARINNHYPEGAVLYSKIQEVTSAREKYYALSDLEKRREYAKEKGNEVFDTLVN